MIGKKSVVYAMALLVTAYVAAPYLSLWRLATALREGDARTLEAVIDWDAVRSGLKEDVAEGIVGMPEDGIGEMRVASNALPPFGASFISGMAASMIDREVTPQHLVALMRQLAPAEPTALGFGAVLGSLGGVEHAFFDSATSFSLRMRCAGQDPDEAPLRVRLEMRGDTWTVVRAWIPQELIERANSRT